MKSRKAVASSASARSLRTILARCGAAHVFGDNPPDLAVMPRSVGVRASWRHTPTVPPATTATSWARRASLAEPHWPFQRTKTRQCTPAAAPRQHSRFGLRSVLWPSSAGRLRIDGIDTGGVRASLPGMPIQAAAASTRHHHIAHRRARRRNSNPTAYGHDCGTNHPETSSQPNLTNLQKTHREHKGLQPPHSNLPTRINTTVNKTLLPLCCCYCYWNAEI